MNKICQKLFPALAFVVTLSIAAGQVAPVDLPAEPNDPTARQQRETRDSLFRVPGPYLPLADENPNKPPRVTSVTPMDLPELPVEFSDVILLGTVERRLPFLSADRKALYTEFRVNIQELLKGDITSNVIDVLQHGFPDPVRLAGGRIIATRTVGYGLPPQEHGLYVFFLKPTPVGNAQWLIKAWRIRDGAVHPTAAQDIRRAEDRSSLYAGMSQDQFLTRLRSSVRELKTKK